jgi:amino acid transporter
MFLTGLANPNIMYVGIDGAIHLAEDAVNAKTAVPWALCAAVVVGFVTAFLFVVVMFYCISDPNAVLPSSFISLFLFSPSFIPVTPAHFNWTVGAFFGAVIISVASWFIYGKRMYHGPVKEVLDQKRGFCTEYSESHPRN